jgi:hypothetical protein
MSIFRGFLNIISIAFLLLSVGLQAQVSDTLLQEEEDYSMYDNLDFAAEGTKRFCTSKVQGLSPQKLVSIGYDFQGPYSLNSGVLGNNFPESESLINYSHGLRLQGNIPVISRNSVIAQLNINYVEQRYAFKDLAGNIHPLEYWLNNNGLRTSGLGTTIFKPLDEKQFILVQASGDLNGDYGWSNLPDIANTRLSVAGIWGKKASDKKMWGIGISRTYRAGDLNYIPVFLLNYTSANGKWGTELLLPAKGHIRRNFSPRSMAFFGYELEGQTYRLNSDNAVSGVPQNIELRRSELRFRAMYEFSLSGFIWLSFQAGYRFNYSFNADELPDNRDFFRGFFGDQPYLFQNTPAGSFYSLVSINLVSP